MSSALCLLALAFLPSMPAFALHGLRPQQAPAPVVRRPPTSGLPATHPTGGGYPEGYGQGAPIQRRPPSHLPRGEHLAEWMSQHSNLSPEQQQQALGREPGFGSLPGETQQRMRNRLAQLDAMNPAKRERVLARTEAMERLSPDQRAVVRGAMGQLGSLPPDQRMMVARTFRALRTLPPEQRLPALNSGRFGPPLNQAQQAVMSDLLRAEPLLQLVDPMPAARPAQPLPPMQQGLSPGEGMPR